jgi:thioredoxin-dependent peroxiredoxin
MAQTSTDDRLTIGAKAPAFALKDQAGQTTRLSGFSGRKVLIFFYPKANTPGCTTQACGLRDIADEIGDTVVIGISPDQPDKLERFDSQHGLGFTLLSDPEHSVAEKYGVWGEKKLYGKTYMGIVRSAFLVDEKGKLEQVWYKISPKDTPKKLLAALG